MQAAVEMISPAMAKEMLEGKLPNRQVSETVVQRYANDMSDDKWENNGQGIIFSERGQLLDGQHRLNAIIRSGRTIAMMVVRGVPETAFVTMDNGKSRVLSDVLHIEGYKYTYNLAAAAKSAYCYAAGVSQSYGPTRSTLEQFITNHPYLSEVTNRVCAPSKKMPKSQLAAVLFMGNEARTLDKEVTGFIDGIMYGERLWKGDARLTFREWWTQSWTSEKYASRGAVAGGVIMGAIIRCWNAYAAGKELARLSAMFSPTRDNMEIFNFRSTLYHDVPDLIVKNRESNLANLKKAQLASQLKQARADRAAQPEAGRAVNA